MLAQETHSSREMKRGDKRHLRPVVNLLSTREAAIRTAKIAWSALAQPDEQIDSSIWKSCIVGRLQL